MEYERKYGAGVAVESALIVRFISVSMALSTPDLS